MTILSELARLYERLAKEGKAPPRGYSFERVGGAVELDADGNVLAIHDLRAPDDKGRLQPRIMAVPTPPSDRRGKKKVSGTFWDPAPYGLGITLEEGGPVISEESIEKHKYFVSHHKKILKDSPDKKLVALRSFVHSWKPEDFIKRKFDPELLAQNVVFFMHDDVGKHGERRYIHECPAAEELIISKKGKESGICMVTGKESSISRLHPPIKFPDPNAQSSGAYLVSFNIGSKKVVGASSSHGKEQGENAPVSEEAAFAYGAALNALLARGSGRNIRIGDATVVFWAETPETGKATTIEELMRGALAPDEKTETEKLASLLADIATGRAATPEFDPATRIFILGLAPNAARLSVRFWRPGTLGDFARNVTRFWNDLAQDPPAWNGPPAAWPLLCETVEKHWNDKKKQWEYKTDPKTKIPAVPPRLGGDLMRAVLSGVPYPQTLLIGVITRIRADHDINPRRVAIIAAVLRRNFKEDIPMSLDRSNPDPAYRLGRLFAVLENIQEAALPGLNATIKDRYFAAAMATPARIFPLLVKNAFHHLANLRKGDKGGLAHWFESEMGEIWSDLEPRLPRSLNLEAQGRFVAGYYHQRWARKNEAKATDATESEGATA